MFRQEDAGRLVGRYRELATDEDAGVRAEARRTLARAVPDEGW